MASVEMVLDRVNELDQPVGTVARTDVFVVGASFRVTHVFIFNRQGQLLLQQLAETRLRHPGRWGSSVAAYVAAGEDYSQAAHRRLEEELGIDLELQFATKTQMPDEGCTKFITLYFARHSGPFNIDSAHIARVEFVGLTDMQNAIKNEPSRFTPTLLHLWETCTQQALISVR